MVRQKYNSDKIAEETLKVYEAVIGRIGESVKGDRVSEF
jgi:hypothetical protein